MHRRLEEQGNHVSMMGGGLGPGGYGLGEEEPGNRSVRADCLLIVVW